MVYWQNIEEADKQIEDLLKLQFIDKPTNNAYKTPQNKQYQKNDPNFDVGYYSYQMSDGVELLEINGVGAATILTLISETGLEMSKFKTAKHFKISGGKVLSSHTRKKTNPLAKVIRDAANAAGNSKSRLGDNFRRLAYRKGRMVVIGATSRKIAVIIYKMLTQGKAFCYEYAQDEAQNLRYNKLKNIVKTLKKHSISKSELELALG